AIIFIAGCSDSALDDDVMLKGGKKVKTEVANTCVSIQDGILTYSAAHFLAGEPLTTGYDIFGYNYQAHLFKGSYVNAYLGAAGFPPYEGDDDAYFAENPAVVNHWAWPYRMYEIDMKWNDAWLANTDCHGDESLDRHYRLPSYIGSGAWEMYSEKMGGPDGYTYKCKIVAAPSDAVADGGVWYTSDGVEIGPVIWGEFAIIQEVQGGSGVDDHGLLYKGLDHTGLGGW
ncbi:MAG: hypothetical protein JW833_04540, partial [Prolixibacteraceae bacterium]|nr:hypothetical protein [Prolixibacteraceae bacterium]